MSVLAPRFVSRATRRRPSGGIAASQATSPSAPRLAQPALAHRALDPRGAGLRAATLLAAIALSVVACGGAASSTVPGASAVTIGSPLVGKPAPALAGTTLDGSSFDLASLKGSPVLVNFWASWCGPCREEFPLLADAAARHAAEGLVVVGALFKDDADPARTFVSQQRATWPTVVDPDRSIGGAWKVLAPPQTFFVDRDGVIREVQVGQLRDAAELDRLLGSILR